MTEVFEPKEHEISIDTAIIKQVVQNRNHPLDVIREALSNSCAREVGTSHLGITIFYDGSYGWSFIFEDDGIGMNYTGEKEPEKQERLDRFLNLAYSGVAGLKYDEFGFKGLGSKLMYLCNRLDIETKTENGESYKVVVEDPIGKLLKQERPEMPKPLIYKNAPVTFQHGTIIRVYGYDDGIKYPEYEDIEKLKRYLYFRTLIGYTKSERLGDSFPKIKIKTPSIPDGEELKVGFSWIKKEGDHVEGQKIGIINPPITVTKEDRENNKFAVTLKGGYALKTGEFGMSDYGILESKGVGLTYAWKGIPYFNLDFNHYKQRGFDLYYKFCRFVVECDDVETDIARSRISDVVKEPLFTAALREAYRKVMETEDYKEWVKYRRELRRKDLGKTLNQRKEELQKRAQRWVFYDEELIHKEPNNEQDVRALLWKLEGKKALPFYHFRTLEHTAQKGIDIIAEYQEEDFSEKKLFQSVEVEHILENYSDHDHVPEQTSLIIAWDSKNRDKLTKVKGEWKYVWEYAGTNLNVILLRYLPNIEVKTK